jgi:hypothetical protein
VAKRSKAPSPFEGVWRIVSMSAWDEPSLHEEVQAFIEFNKRGGGEFQFCYVHGFMDCRLAVRDGEPAIEWTWEGNDEMDPVHGRGWAVLKGAQLHGMIFFHQGDESEFVAKKVVSSKRANRNSPH